MNALYSIQQFETQGWVTIAKNLLKEDAQKRLDALLYEGLNPKDLKIIREK